MYVYGRKESYYGACTARAQFVALEVIIWARKPSFHGREDGFRRVFASARSRIEPENLARCWAPPRPGDPFESGAKATLVFTLILARSTLGWDVSVSVYFRGGKEPWGKTKCWKRKRSNRKRKGWNNYHLERCSCLSWCKVLTYQYHWRTTYVQFPWGNDAVIAGWEQLSETFFRKLRSSPLSLRSFALSASFACGKSIRTRGTWDKESKEEERCSRFISERGGASVFLVAAILVWRRIQKTCFVLGLIGCVLACSADA